MSASRYTCQVAWGHCDPAGIVFYPHLFGYFDEATWHLFGQAGITLQVMRERYQCLGIPLVDAQASFKSPCRFGDVLEVESRVSHWGEKAFTVEHVIRNSGQVATVGREVRIWGVVPPDQPQRLKAAPVPPEVRRALEALAAG